MTDKPRRPSARAPRPERRSDPPVERAFARGAADPSGHEAAGGETRGERRRDATERDIGRVRDPEVDPEDGGEGNAGRDREDSANDGDASRPLEATSLERAGNDGDPSAREDGSSDPDASLERAVNDGDARLGQSRPPTDRESGTPREAKPRRTSAKRSTPRRPPRDASDDAAVWIDPRTGEASAAARAALAPAPTGSPRRERPAASRDPHPREVEGAVLITGICGRLGRLLARKLHREGPVIGIDRRPFVGKPKDIVHHQFDMRRKKTRDVFRAGGIRAVVHLGIMHDPRESAKAHHSWNVVAFQKLLEYLHQYDVPKLIMLSSANVYGPSPDNPQFLTEEAPLLGAQHFSAIRDLVEVDMLAQSFFWRHPETETVVLRPCHILGGVRNAPSNYLRLPRPVALMGFDPMVQLIHERDVVEAIALALQPGVRGIFNLKGPGEVPMSRVFRVLGKRPRTVPATLARPVLERMWRYRMTSFPTPELDHIRYVCMVDDSRARDILGFRPNYSLEDTIRAVETEL